MKEYKGYYIDKVIFNSKEDIDEFIKRETINKYKLLCKEFVRDSCMELIGIMEPYERKLHNEFGLTYDEIEAIEIEAYEEVA